MQQSQRIRDGLQAVQEWEAEHGALSDEQLMRARERVISEPGKPD